MMQAMLRSAVGLAAVAVALVAVGAGAPAPAATDATVFDRTYSCSMLQAGSNFYVFEPRGHAGTRADAGAWSVLPAAVVGSARNLGTGANVMSDSLAWISAGNFTGATKLDIPNWGAAIVTAQEYGTLAVNTRLCRPAQTRIPLTARNLEGGAVGQLNEEFDCEAPRRVLLRVRATSKGAIRLTRDGRFLRARTGFREGFVAVRTPAGRPLLFATVADTGKTRIFASRRTCFPA